MTGEKKQKTAGQLPSATAVEFVRCAGFSSFVRQGHWGGGRGGGVERSVSATGQLARYLSPQRLGSGGLPFGASQL